MAMIVLIAKSFDYVLYFFIVTSLSHIISSMFSLLSLSPSIDEAEEVGDSCIFI